ncbi:MAG: large-conductance mechanosensitive channel protein MscL [Bacteroides sp.]|nr:large-conductance mechanosensitive channel protein MscL [Bacteroides sp.]MCM1378783.1 large-conductance mechanosensitive channel protein MscL [Bacteroides sp.]MCM1445400.1 large-conductance mechanosensitive channel protein MscL [Prevotella sp.]
MSFLSDFKAFAMKGNILDMAVGVIIGGAFGKIVTSLVNDVIMPCVGILTGGVNFTELKAVLHDAVLDPTTQEVVKEAVTLNYGMFIQNIVDFLIIAFSIFCALKAIMKFKKQEEAKEEAPAPAPEPTKEEVLLTEIRDILKNKE